MKQSKFISQATALITEAGCIPPEFEVVNNTLSITNPTTGNTYWVKSYFLTKKNLDSLINSYINDEHNFYDNECDECCTDEHPGQTHIDFDKPTRFASPEDELAYLETMFSEGIPESVMSAGLIAWLDADDESIDSEPDYCKQCHNLSMIDDIIANTLARPEPLKPRRADTLIKLAQLKLLLIQANS